MTDEDKMIHERVMKRGGPVFPVVLDMGRTHHQFTGMDHRTFLAGLAMLGYLAGRNALATPSTPENAARWCCQHADALMAELAKEKV